MLKKGNRFEAVQPPVPLPLDQDKQRPRGSWLWGLRSDLIEDGEGSIWWQMTGKGIARLKAGNWTVFTPTNGLPGGAIRQMVCDGEGRVWIVAGGRLFCFYDDTWNSSQSAILARGGRLCWHRRPRVGFGRLNRRSRGPRTVGKFTGSQTGIGNLLRLPYPREVTLTGLVVSALHEDRTGHIWVGGNPTGLSYFDAKGLRHELEPKTSLSHRFASISCLFEDRQGSIWVGANTGLYRDTAQPLTMLPILDSAEQVFTTCATRDGTVWVGTETAGVFRVQEGSLARAGGDWGTNTPQIFSLFQDSRTNLWAGTSRGLFRMEGQQFPARFRTSTDELGRSNL